MPMLSEEGMTACRLHGMCSNNRKSISGVGCNASQEFILLVIKFRNVQDILAFVADLVASFPSCFMPWMSIRLIFYLVVGTKSIETVERNIFRGCVTLSLDCKVILDLMRTDIRVKVEKVDRAKRANRQPRHFII